MANTLTELVAIIKADDSPLRKSLAGLKTSLAGPVSKLATSLGSQFSRSFNLAAKAGLAGLLAGGGFVTKIASDAEEIRSKFATIFSTTTKEAESFAQTLAKKVGRSVIDIRKSMSDFGAVLSPIGFAEKDALELSKQISALAIDMASFSNTTDAEAGQALISGLLGESEPLKRYGVVLNETKVNAELLAMGIRGGAKAATDAQETMARMNIIMSATQLSQGDAERTSGSLANTMKSFQGVVKDLAGDLGQALIPAATEVVASLRDWASGLQRHRDQFASWGKTIGEKVTSVISGIKDFVGTNREMLLGIVQSIPKLLAFAVAAKGIGLAIGAVAAILGKSSLALLLSPTGALVVGVTALAGAFAHAKLTGQSWGESITELTGKLFGFETRVSAANAALAENRKLASGSKAFTGTLKDLNAKRDAGTLTTADVDAAIAELEGQRDAEKARARKLIGESMAAGSEAQRIGREARGSWWNTEWHKVPGLETKSKMLGDEGKRASVQAKQIQDRIDKLNQEKAQLAGKEAVTAQNQKSMSNWKDYAKGLGSQLFKAASGAGKDAMSKGKQLVGKIQEGGLGVVGAIANGLAYEQQMRQGGGSAARTASFSGISDYGRELQSAIGGSADTEKKLVKQTADESKKTNTWLQKVFDQMVISNKQVRPGVAT